MLTFPYRLPALDAAEFSYVQACDFLQASATLIGDAYIEAAVDGRGPHNRSALVGIQVSRPNIARRHIAKEAT